MSVISSNRVLIQILSVDDPAHDMFVMAPKGVSEDCARGFVDMTIEQVKAHHAEYQFDDLSEPMAQAGYTFVYPITAQAMW